MRWLTSSDFWTLVHFAAWFLMVFCTDLFGDGWTVWVGFLVVVITGLICLAQQVSDDSGYVRWWK